MTPCFMHFAGVLLQSLLILAPWPSPWYLGIPFAALGVGGLALRGSDVAADGQSGHRQSLLFDWLAYAGTPAIACSDRERRLWSHGRPVGSTAGHCARDVPFLFAAIYQAWDLTLWIVRNRKNESDSSY